MENTNNQKRIPNKHILARTQRIRTTKNKEQHRILITTLEKQLITNRILKLEQQMTQIRKQIKIRVKKP